MEFLDAFPDIVKTTEEGLRRGGWFDPVKVQKLLAKLRTVPSPSETESMALAGILSTQMVQQQFVDDFSACTPDSVPPGLLIDRRSGTSEALSA